MFKSAFNFYYISTRTDRDEGRGGSMAVELLGQLIVQFLFSLSPFFSFSPPSRRSNWNQDDSDSSKVARPSASRRDGGGRRLKLARIQEIRSGDATPIRREVVEKSRWTLRRVFPPSPSLFHFVFTSNKRTPAVNGIGTAPKLPAVFK